MDSSVFILWVIIQYYLILLLKPFQLWSLGIFHCVPLTYSHNCFGFGLCNSLLSVIQDVPGSVGVFPAPALESAISLQSPSGARNQDLGTGWQFPFKRFYHTSDSESCISLEGFQYVNKNIDYIF